METPVNYFEDYHLHQHQMLSKLSELPGQALWAVEGRLISLLWTSQERLLLLLLLLLLTGLRERDIIIIIISPLFTSFEGDKPDPPGNISMGGTAKKKVKKQKQK